MRCAAIQDAKLVTKMGSFKPAGIGNKVGIIRNFSYRHEGHGAQVQLSRVRPLVRGAGEAPGKEARVRCSVCRAGHRATGDQR